jgi:hypothetical protein
VKKLLPIIGIIVTMVVLIYLESPYSLINKDYVEVTSIPNEVLQAEATAVKTEAVMSDTETDEGESKDFLTNYTLEMIFEERMIEGDYVIEEYREYEVSRDKNGEIIKSVPTSNYDYIRYYTEQ